MYYSVVWSGNLHCPAHELLHKQKDYVIHFQYPTTSIPNVKEFEINWIVESDLSRIIGSLDFAEVLGAWIRDIQFARVQCNFFLASGSFTDDKFLWLYAFIFIVKMVWWWTLKSSQEEAATFKQFKKVWKAVTVAWFIKLFRNLCHSDRFGLAHGPAHGIWF